MGRMDDSDASFPRQCRLRLFFLCSFLGDSLGGLCGQDAPPGGLPVQVRRRRRVEVRPGAPAEPEWAASVTIADDGRGIPADLLPRVFEPRFSTTSSGSGLGLAIVKRLVDDWGGEVALDSRPGAGTTATLRLRAAAPAHPAAAVRDSAE